jgi:hypothetical protein
MESEGSGGPPVPSWGHDELLDSLKGTAAERERAREERALGRRVVAGAVAAVVAVVAGAVVLIHALTTTTTHLHVPARIGDFSRIESPQLDAAIKRSPDENGLPGGDEASASFYASDPDATRPELMLVLYKGRHTDQDAIEVRSLLEAPLGSGHAATPVGASARNVKVGNVDFYCEPVIENGVNGPVGERTGCVWDDHDLGLGVLIDLHSGEVDVVLREAEKVQPSTLH